MVQISQSGINTLFSFPMGENAERMQIVQESLEKEMLVIFLTGLLTRIVPSGLIILVAVL